MLAQKTKPHFHGHRARLKERFEKAGLSGWQEYEVLELLLSYSQPRRDTKPAAKKLLEKFKTLHGVLSATPQQLCEVPGIKSHAALLLKFTREVACLYAAQPLKDKELLSSPGAVVEYLQAYYKAAPEEEFRALFLNSANKLIEAETLQYGTVDRAAVYPRHMAERALHYKAARVIVSHNHPAGTAGPSADDRSVTILLKNALQTVEVELIDHIIIAGDGYYSFKECGLL
jgi:DNA repair protein RadC